MRCSTSALVLAAMVVGDAMASPAHAHLHKLAHEKKDVDWKGLDWANMGIDWSSAWAAGRQSKTAAPAVATAAPSPADAPPAQTTPAGSSNAASTINSIADDVNSLWRGVVGHSNSRTSFGDKNDTLPGCTTCTSKPGPLSQGDNYPGNFGAPYGSNIIKVPSTSGYDFTNTFTNTQSKTITVNIWNKVGSDGQIQSGAFLAPKDTALTFALAAGASQVVAFMENSQVAWAQACDELTFPGSFKTSWGEAQFRGDGCGYDVSAILNPGNNYAMTINSAEAPHCTSDRNQNMWIAEYTPVGGSDGSCYIRQSTAHLKTTMGGTV